MEIIKELLQFNNHALQVLHCVLGLDFKKPFTTFKISGRFTVKQILKQVNADNMIIAAYVNNKYCKYFNLVTVNYSGGVENDYKIPYYEKTRGEYHISHYYAKKCFEDDRKEEKTTAYIIAQSKEYIKKPVENPVNYQGARFNYIDCGFTGYNGNSYINRITVKSRDKSGEKYTRQLISQIFDTGMISHYKKSVAELIDKSGYFVDYKRDDLKRRAAALKAQREKAAFIESDNTDKITELETLINQRKKEIEKAFTAAVTSNDINAVAKMLNDYKTGLYWIMYYFELFKNRINNKEYSSIKTANNAYNDIKTMLTGGENI